jgi:hypothetical protein
MESMTNESITTEVSVSEHGLEVGIRDPRTDSVAAFAPLSPDQQGQLAHEAWFIGLRAVTNARRLADEARLGDVGKTLLEDLGHELRAHTERHGQQIHDALSRYFDPESGHVGERMRQLVGEGGTLAHLLDRHVGPQNSVLVETLVKHLGEQSPLFRRLSPTDSEGILQLLGERLEKTLAEEHSEFQKALDPYCEDGAVGRFIARLRDELKRSNDDQGEQLTIALAALDTTKEDSLLNQMRRETHEAREHLLHAINPAAEGSALSLIQHCLMERLEHHARSQEEQLEQARKLTVEFHRDIREAVQRIAMRKHEDLRNTRGGGVFEDAVLAFTEETIGEGYTIDNVGCLVGLRQNSKKGDGVVNFPKEHGFHGARVVVEAKRDKSYTTNGALEELSEARANRDACAGVFVMAKSHAPSGFPTFRRFGQDVLVVWDDEDPSTDPYLQAALMVGLALAVRNRANADEGDINALQAIEQRLVKELERLEKIKDAAAKIRRQVDFIDAEAEKGAKGLSRVIADAKKTLVALKVELRDDEVEREAPIGLDVGLPENDALPEGWCGGAAE